MVSIEKSKPHPRASLEGWNSANRPGRGIYVRGDESRWPVIAENRRYHCEGIDAQSAQLTNIRETFHSTSHAFSLCLRFYRRRDSLPRSLSSISRRGLATKTNTGPCHQPFTFRSRYSNIINERATCCSLMELSTLVDHFTSTKIFTFQSTIFCFFVLPLFGRVKFGKADEKKGKYSSHCSLI